MDRTARMGARMDARELVGRLDGMFRPEAFDEHDGWDFAFGPGEREALPERAEREFAATVNGLMLGAVGGAGAQIDRAYLLVFPEAGLIEGVIAAEQE
jgi:hypothetical protein